MLPMLAAAAVLFVASSLSAGDCRCTPGPGAIVLGEAPLCGHHVSIWGFSMDLPPGSCGDPYLHGLLLALPGDPEGSISVFAAYNALPDRSVRALGRDSFEANVPAGARVLSRRPFVLGGIGGQRWIVRYRDPGSGMEMIRDDVYVLRRVRAAKGEPPDYEYTFSLVTPAALRAHDEEIFDACLRSVRFTEPDM